MARCMLVGSPLRRLFRPHACFVLEQTLAARFCTIPASNSTCTKDDDGVLFVFLHGEVCFQFITSFGFAEHIFLDNLDNLKNIDAREPRSVCGPVSALVACMHAPYMRDGCSR